ncbi:MAG: EF-P beta-lysylation protein EpmB [Legionellaceae bacterium]|nr:EF-P beta-lysylation protein EpmB [Legionellaceae bacterium]
MREMNASWQRILAEGFASSRALLDYLELPNALGSTAAEQLFKTRVPRGFAACMKKGDPNDPLLRQVLAISDELISEPGFVPDPLDEAAYNPKPGLIHKYAGRVLLTVAGACAVNCRYCFRRHFPYAENNPGRAGWADALAYIEADASIHEVILSGGDPLLAPDATLQFLIHALEAIPHVHTLRIHTRLPVVLPERVDVSLCALLSKSRFQCVVVLHANHAAELSEGVRNACRALREAGCHVLNQSVLLAGVNNSVEALVALSKRLWVCGVLPYYLHVLDKVEGAAHFSVSDLDIKKLRIALPAHLPGYLVPRLVQEVPGAQSKIQVR